MNLNDLAALIMTADDLGLSEFTISVADLRSLLEAARKVQAQAQAQR